VRLATFNLLHGRSPHDGLVDAQRLRAAVAALDADVLALQEADRGQPRSAGADHTAEAAKALGADYHRFAAALIGTPGAAYRLPVDGTDDVTADPSYGIGLISRWPVTDWLILRLPAAPARSPVYVPRVGMVLLADEPRVVLAALVDSPVGRLTVASTHLSFVPGWNLRQLRRTLRWLAALPGPRILLGDLNIPMRMVAPLAAAAGWRPLARVATYPAPRPRVQFDHVLLHPRRTAWSARAEAPLAPISDHRPLVVGLTS
jgi:endonuclease/exonuclease/phosphatase family metal-dependent hydrolase